MIERSLKDAIQQFRKKIEDSDQAKIEDKGKYDTVDYRIKLVRDDIGERMYMKNDRREIGNGKDKYKAKIKKKAKKASTTKTKMEEACISANGGNFDPRLEERKVKALEKIANSVDALTLWFEEIDKEEWGPRIEWQLSMWKEKYIDGEK